MAAVASAFVAGLARRQAARPARPSGRQQAARCICRAGASAPPLAKYVNLIITSDNGGKLQVEIKETDTVRVLKAMINMNLGLPEEQQDLSFGGKALAESEVISECGLKEGSTVLLKVQEEEKADAEDDAPVVSTIDGEVCCRISVKCEMGVGKARIIKLDVPLTDTITDAKKKAYEEFIVGNESIRDLPMSEYGLFLLKGEQMENGQLRWLRRDERMKEKKTVEENGLKGGEELIFASLFWYEG